MQLAADFIRSRPALIAGGYNSVGSTAGIAGFLGTSLPPGQSTPYAAATSDDPMSAIQDGQATNSLGGKITFPLALTTYSFFTQKGKGIKISGKTLASIYIGKTTQWSAVQGGLSGTIVPYCRNSGSGTTQVITKYLNYYESSIPVTSAVLTTVAPFSSNPNLKSPPASNYPSGSLGMVQAVKDNGNAIAYMQTGIGASAKLIEIAVGNPVGSFLRMTSGVADPFGGIPRALPLPTASWNGVYLTNGLGKATYPIVSFEYTFLRQAYNGAFPGAIPNLKAFFKFVLTPTGQNLGKKSFFTTVPSKVSRRAFKAIKAITP